MFEALIDFGENWDDHSLALLAGGNLLRVLRQVDYGGHGGDDEEDDGDDDDDEDGSGDGDDACWRKSPQGAPSG